jgi:hypothetical protein
MSDWVIVYLNRSTGQIEEATHTGSDTDEAAINFYNCIRTAPYVAEILFIERYVEHYY